MKKTLLFVIDALCSRVVRPALESGRLPHLEQLAQNGCVRWNCVSVFPSITPAATASICTGAYPAEHRIMGAFYFDREKDRVHYYGPDFWVVVEKGLADFVSGFLVKLNHERLRAETLLQRAEIAGREAASLNYLLFRGDRPHKAHTPWLLRLVPGVPWSARLQGPTTLCLGDFTHNRILAEKTVSLRVGGGPLRRFGFNDESTRRMLLQLVKQGMPDFTLAYFPDNDFESHERGPVAALDVVEKVDRCLGEFADRFGGMDALLEQFAVVITGDHGHDDIASDERQAAIDLESLLADFSLATTGDAWDESDELMICPNLRAAQIYVRPRALERLDELVARLVQHEAVDQVIWHNGLREDDQSVTYHVATAKRGTLSFTAAPTRDQAEPSWRCATDDYGNRWGFQGELSAVDARIEGDQLLYGDYPNAFERLAMAFEPRMSGDVWVTARPGREFSYPGVELHLGGGSHGSLHAQDSLAPLFVAGLPNDVTVPSKPRIVDITPMILDILGAGSTEKPAAHAMGDPRVGDTLAR